MTQSDPSKILREKSGHEGYSFRRNLATIRPEGWVLLGTLFTLWLLFTERQTKIDSVSMALTYSYIEYSWYTFTYETVDRVVRIAPLHMKGRDGFTTVEQFIGNSFYLPIAMNGYAILFQCVGALFFPSIIDILIVFRIILFPFNIWLLEIVQHEVLKFIFGFNPAWDYTGAPGSRCDGAINLSHAKLWVFLGILAATCTPMHGIIFMIVLLTLVHILRFVCGLRNKKQM